ncbi:MAG TPA: hypothetical protein VG675_07005 [Bryobacteraceae bacterium]|nr:hypothetical protein [Bryobacteraceae bacterium]
MRRLERIALILPLLVWGAAAQDTSADQPVGAAFGKQVMALQSTGPGGPKTLPPEKLVVMQTAVMGPVVTNAPYSATGVTETNQELTDGTHIHQQNQYTIYRDSEGRIRREDANRVWIWDPVAKVSYILDPKAQTATKLPLGTSMAGGAGNFVYFNAKAGVAGVAAAGVPAPPLPPPLPPPTDLQEMAQVKQKIALQEMAQVKQKIATMGPMIYMQSGTVSAQMPVPAEKTEDLGKQSIEGVMSEGMRNTMTLETGAIGNDRPIQIVSEHWYSPELQTTIMTKHSDPRTGEETFRLTNISRGEPNQSLFQVPAGYQMTDQK